MYSVRFHLQNGPNYKFWQIRNLKDKSEAPIYLDPNKFQIYLYDCKLVCKENAAKRVFNAGVIDVCGWVECKMFAVYDLQFTEPESVDGCPRVSFNPIVDTNWRIESSDESYNNQHCAELITRGGRVYLVAMEMETV